MFLSYLWYWWQRRNEHSLHSPFVFELYTQVIKPKRYASPSAFDEIESLRQSLRQNSSTISVLDLGAGSRLHKSPERRIRDIVQSAEKPAFLAQLLYRLVAHFRPSVVFDLGTSLGLTTLYLAKAQAQARVFTFEGCPQTAALAQEHFERLSCSNIQTVVGNIDHTLTPQIQQISQLDFVFFDANHRFEPTVRYFEECLLKAHDDSVFVFDDIHWSADMEKAW